MTASDVPSAASRLLRGEASVLAFSRAKIDAQPRDAGRSPTDGRGVRFGHPLPDRARADHVLRAARGRSVTCPDLVVRRVGRVFVDMARLAELAEPRPLVTRKTEPPTAA